MRLCKVVINIMLYPGRRVTLLCLFMPPYTISVCRRAEHITIAVAIQVPGIHLCTVVAEVRLVKRPSGLFPVFRSFPPTIFNDDIFSAIAIYVAITQTMSEAVRPYERVVADHKFFPIGIRLSGRGSQPYHFSFCGVVAE